MPRFALTASAALLLCYVYLWLWVDPRLLYYRVAPPFPYFWLGWRFLAPFLAEPGGPTQYVSDFLSQLFYYSWAGALVIAGIAGGLLLGTRALLRSLRWGDPGSWAFVPAVLLLFSYSRYAHHLAEFLALLAALSAVCLYVWIPTGSAAARSAVFLVLSALVYYVAGGAYLLFAVVCGLFELLVRRRAVGVLYLCLAAALPYLAGAELLEQRISDAYWRLLPFHRTAEQGALAFALGAYLFFPLAAVVGGFLPRRAEPPPEGADGPPAPSDGPLGRILAGRLPRPALVAGALALAGACLLWSLDVDVKRVLQVECYAHRGMWLKIPPTAHRVSRRHYDLVVCLTVNWALYHTGRLPYDMLKYPQQPLGLIRMPEEFIPYAKGGGEVPTPLAFVRLSDIYLDLGRVNESEHMAHEAMEGQGYRPWVLERIAFVNIVKGRPDVARHYLGALSRDLIYGKQARDWLRALDADPGLSSNADVARARSLWPRLQGRGTRSIEGVLTELLENDGRNRMAFEYLMAHYLLTGDLEGIVRNVGRCVELGYDPIPRYYEEAMALYVAVGGAQTESVVRAVSEATWRRLQEFERRAAAAGSDRRAAFAALVGDYRDSYFLYYTYFLAPETGE